ncbi:hypothetical protein SASPL_156218 [Salvia splendens]|uniref:Polygalacturonase n=1 Tax=Salvia splendens TaxID=180675 RepID=A0A8X8VX51_SALSN|nr:hypothetical protein SASPL_156218 [Salvia splendens]
MQAFEAAWAAACKVEASVVNVPSDYVFHVGPISFSGPILSTQHCFPVRRHDHCSDELECLGFRPAAVAPVHQISGADDQGKRRHRRKRGQSGGRAPPPTTIPLDDQSKYIIPVNATALPKPPFPVSSSLAKMPSVNQLIMQALRFYGSFNVTVTGITIKNSPQCHLKLDNCIGVSVYNFTVSSPGNSPNTDGIHLQNSKDVLIRSSNLACDRCVTFRPIKEEVREHVGRLRVDSNRVHQRVHTQRELWAGARDQHRGLGKDNTKACVSNITVRDIVMHNTMNGVRIKTWQGGSGSVKNVQFSNIQVSEVQVPIVIDQYYCDKRSCTNQTEAVALSGINYANIRGTYTVKPVHFSCSDNAPCTEVTLMNIQLKPQQEGYHMYDPFCWQTFGQLYTPTVPPLDCLQIGKPANNHIQGDDDVC